MAQLRWGIFLKATERSFLHLYFDTFVLVKRCFIHGRNHWGSGVQIPKNLETPTFYVVFDE